MKKNSIGIKLVLLGVILFVFCIGVSFFWYRIFKTDKVAVTHLTIALKDHGKGVEIDDLVPKDDHSAKKMPAYSFDISNTGDSRGSYEVLLEDSVKKDEDGYASENMLERSELKYELTLNGKVIATDSLSSIKNNVLDSRVIGAKKTNVYRLRIWIPMDATNWQNKIYHYSVVVKPVSEGE